MDSKEVEVLLSMVVYVCNALLSNHRKTASILIFLDQEMLDVGTVWMQNISNDA